jgi:hypothetical protein
LIYSPRPSSPSLSQRFNQNVGECSSSSSQLFSELPSNLFPKCN